MDNSATHNEGTGLEDYQFRKREDIVEDTKARIISIIEQKAGRRIPLHAVEQFDVRQPDSGLWEWKCDKHNYPSLPKTTIQKWNKQQLQECNNALDNGYLTVIAAEAKSRPSVSALPKRTGVDKPQTATFCELLTDDVLATINRRATEWENEHKAELRATQTKLHKLEDEVQKYKKKQNADALKIDALEKQVAKLEKESSIDAGSSDARIALARRQGILEGRRAAYKESDEEVEELHRELHKQRQAHRQALEEAQRVALEDFVKVGREARLQTGSVLSVATSVPEEDRQGGIAKTTNRDGATTTREDMPWRRTFGAGTTSGCGAARNVQKADRSRKALALETIRRNWGDDPDEVLPRSMFPLGHTDVASEKTIRTLATFSNLVKKKRAIELLTEAVALRTEGYPGNDERKKLTTGDINNARMVWEEEATSSRKSTVDNDLALAAAPIPRLPTRNSNLLQPSVEQSPPHGPGPRLTTSGTVRQEPGQRSQPTHAAFPKSSKRVTSHVEEAESHPKRPRTQNYHPRLGSVCDSEHESLDGEPGPSTRYSGDTITVINKLHSVVADDADRISAKNPRAPTDPVDGRERPSSSPRQESSRMSHTTAPPQPGSSKFAASLSRAPGLWEKIDKYRLAEAARRKDAEAVARS